MTRSQSNAATDFKDVIIENPKRDPSNVSGRATWYPYYAGFSPLFARSFFNSLGLKVGSTVLDPWNGSGTTIEAAAQAGHHAKGFDVNPVMLIVARARMLSDTSRHSLGPLSDAIIDRARAFAAVQVDRADPLQLWLTPESAMHFRRLEAGIQYLLIGCSQRRFLDTPDNIRQLSDLAAFYYLALFRTARLLLRRFFTSNPTWVKSPAKRKNRLRPSLDAVLTSFGQEVAVMTKELQPEWTRIAGGRYTLDIASSEQLPIQDKSVDAVLSSPPYCTRIDYAVSTSVELAVLGIDNGNGMAELRQAMIGSAVVPREAPRCQSAWGRTCVKFLEHVANHRSKASSTYYLKSHLQYFSSMFRSLSEISRVLSLNGTCALVVQDSRYKEVHNDLPKIIVEMAQVHNLRLGRQVNFVKPKTMAGLHPYSRQYRAHPQAKESVLLFTRS